MYKLKKTIPRQRNPFFFCKAIDSIFQAKQAKNSSWKKNCTGIFMIKETNWIVFSFTPIEDANLGEDEDDKVNNVSYCSSI